MILQPINIPLDQFETHIDETILQRGYSYFRAGKAHLLEETGPGEYRYLVEGSDDYQVELSIKNRVLVEQACSCPYNMGPVCKHLAAVLLDLQKDELGLKVSKNSKRKPKAAKSARKPARKPKTLAEQVDHLLQKAHREELEEFLRKQAAGDRHFRDAVIAAFAHHSAKDSKSLYAKQIKSLVRSASGRSGFIRWSAAAEVGNGVADLLEKAEDFRKAGNYQSAFYICTASMEQLVKALEHTDDSSGTLGGCIHSAFEIFQGLAAEKENESLRQRLLKYCISAYEKKIYRGWDWHFEILATAEELAQTPQEIERLLGLVNQPETYSFLRESLDTLKYRLLVKGKGEAYALEYLEKNLENPNLRRIALELAFNDNDHERCISLAREGVAQHRNTLPGLANEWRRWLLKLARTQEDSVAILEHARCLFLYDTLTDEDYFGILKEQVPPETWPDFLETLIADAKERDPWDSYGLLPEIYIKEKAWKRLLELLREKPDLRGLSSYAPYLLPSYHEEVMELYGAAILKHLKKNVGRNHYQFVCQYLREIRKMGGAEKVESLVAELRVKYANRKALLEELDRL